MRNRLILAGIVAVLAVALTVPMMANGATRLTAKMSGSEIVNPNGGDPDGSAVLRLRVNRVKQRICYVLRFENLDAVTGAFIHRGAAGAVGRDAAVLFNHSATSPEEGCEHNIKSRIIKRLKRKPTVHYADVTTKKYPDGAVRGQFN